MESVFIQYLLRSSELEARELYNNSKYQGAYSSSQFFEKIANTDELKERLNKGLSDAFELELCSFVRCSLRNENFELAVELSSKLVETYPNKNSRILLALCSAFLINKQIDGKHYWLVPSHLKHIFDSQVNNVIELTEEFPSDPRVTQCAAILLASAQVSVAKLKQACLNQIEDAEKVVPNIRFLISENNDSSTGSIDIRGMLESEHLILDEANVMAVYSGLTAGAISRRDIESLMARNPSFSVTQEYEKDFLQILLRSFACSETESLLAVELSGQVDFFVKKHLNHMSKFNLILVYELCSNFNRLRMNFYSVQLLKPLLTMSPWLSPVVVLYAEALLESDQIQEFDRLFARVNADTDSFFIAGLRFRRACKVEDFNLAINIAKSELKKNPKNTYFWIELLRVLHLSKASSEHIQSEVSRLPLNILEKFSDEGIQLLNFLSKTNMPLVNSILIEWFIDDPVKMATYVTNIHLSSLTRGEDSVAVSSSSSRCSQAIVYSNGKHEFTKLLVNGCETDEYLLDSSSELAQLLDGTNCGETFDFKFTTHRVIEKLHPLVGIFRIATTIRSNLNTGDDCFYQIPIEGDGVDGVKKLVESLASSQKKLAPVLDGRAVPILLRLKHSYPGDLVRGAFSYLCDREANKGLTLFSEGLEVESFLALDVMSLVYLSLTGLSNGFLSAGIKPVISRETHEIVMSWLEQVTSENYFSIISHDEAFIKVTSDDTLNDKRIMNLRVLLKSCELCTPSAVDMPENLVKIKGYFDPSHYSALKISLSESIPILCIDQNISQLYFREGLHVANASQLMVNLSKNTPSAESLCAEADVYFGLPAPILYNELLDLCRNSQTQFLASEILKKHSNDFSSQDEAFRVLTQCCIVTISSAYLGLNHSQLSLSEWQYAEHIVNACCESAMQCLDGETYEERLAVLIAAVLKVFDSIDGIDQFVIRLFGLFIQGHFLDVKEVDRVLSNIRLSENINVAS